MWYVVVAAASGGGADGKFTLYQTHNAKAVPYSSTFRLTTITPPSIKTPV